MRAMQAAASYDKLELVDFQKSVATDGSDSIVAPTGLTEPRRASFAERGSCTHSSSRYVR